MIALLKLDVIPKSIAAGITAQPKNIFAICDSFFIFVPDAHILAAAIIITLILTSSAG